MVRDSSALRLPECVVIDERALMRAGGERPLAPRPRPERLPFRAGVGDSAGQRVNVTRFSFKEAQLERVTCTYTFLMLPPQSTQ